MTGLVFETVSSHRSEPLPETARPWLIPWVREVSRLSSGIRSWLNGNKIPHSDVQYAEGVGAAWLVSGFLELISGIPAA